MSSSGWVVLWRVLVWLLGPVRITSVMKRYGYFVVYRVIIVSFWMMNLKYLASICVLNFCSVWGQRCIELVVFASLYQHNLLTLVLVTWNRTLCASSVDTTYIYLHWCAAAALPRLFAYRSVIWHTSFFCCCLCSQSSILHHEFLLYKTEVRHLGTAACTATLWMSDRPTAVIVSTLPCWAWWSPLQGKRKHSWF